MISIALEENAQRLNEETPDWREVCPALRGDRAEWRCERVEHAGGVDTTALLAALLMIRVRLKIRRKQSLSFSPRTRSDRKWRQEGGCA